MLHTEAFESNPTLCDLEPTGSMLEAIDILRDIAERTRASFSARIRFHDDAFAFQQVHISSGDQRYPDMVAPSGLEAGIREIHKRHERILQGHGFSLGLSGFEIFSRWHVILPGRWHSDHLDEGCDTVYYSRFSSKYPTTIIRGTVPPYLTANDYEYFQPDSDAPIPETFAASSVLPWQMAIFRTGDLHRPYNSNDLDQPRIDTRGMICKIAKETPLAEELRAA